MRKAFTLFLLSLLIPIVCTSQNIYPQILNDSLVVITPLQLKQTNLIFAEHSRLKQENQLLNSKIALLNRDAQIFHSIDSLRVIQLNNNTTTINNLTEAYNQSNKKIKFFRSLSIGGFCLSAALIIFTVIK
jgi:hypothetical protein